MFGTFTLKNSFLSRREQGACLFMQLAEEDVEASHFILFSYVLFIAGLHPQSFPSYYVTTFGASLAKLTVLLPQPRDVSYYVTRPILTSTGLVPQKQTDLRAHDFAHSPVMWQARLTNVTETWNWRLCGINPAVPKGMLSCKANFH